MATRFLLCLLLLTLPGCGWFNAHSIDSQDSIRRDADRRPDPAIRTPYTGVGAPGQADSPQQEPPPGRPLLIKATTQPTYRPIDDPARANLLLRAWVDDWPANEALTGRIVRVRPPASRQPRIRFEMDPRLGQFRGASIQIYRIIAGQPDIASGIRLAEDGDYSVLLPGKDINLARLKGVTCQRTATGQAVSRFELDPASEYEIQFLISGSRQVGSLAVRVHTAAPEPAPPASQPENAPVAQTRPANPDQFDPAALPPGVSIPKQ